MPDSTTASVCSNDIAIIGMAARLPGAPNVEAFWRNVRDGVESIVSLDDETLLAAGVSRAEINDPDYVKVCPLLDDIDKFDAGFFGFNPREASVMDPAHRIFLEIAWAAFENAGYSALPGDGSVGVWATSGAPLYLMENVKTRPDLVRSMGDFLLRHTGNDMNFLATRVSYEMDLRGPSINIQTACSSALVALHMAAQSLNQKECDMALIGGSTILVPHGQGYLYKEGEILSPDGHCRPFDANSAGTVFGSGAGALILKRLDDALDDGDTIHAVVKGSAINNDGAMKVGYLAPGVEGQADVISAALAAANVSAESITYIETHGTGTLVGDPIEVEALNEAYSRHTNKRGYCGIGSVKSNIGHLGETAAVAALIKAIMALKNRQLPPSLGFEAPNPAMNLEDSPFYVNDTLQDWQTDGPRRCGVTALGAGGTNCHVILQEAPLALPGENERSQQLFVLSAKTETALQEAAGNLAMALEQAPDIELADAAYTLAVGRREMPHRRIVVAGDREDAIARLRDPQHKLTATARADDNRPNVVFMFPGGGAQYAGMGHDLYMQEEVYRDAVKQCLDIITPKLGREFEQLLYPQADDVEKATRILEQPSLTLPALFTTSYALSCLYESWGLQPDAFIGHSMGEYVAACKAGVFTLEEALTLVMLRGELFECIDQGSMLSVPLSEQDVRALAPAALDIAAVNAPDLCVASGPRDEIAAFQQTLTEREIDFTPIRIDVAAHSRMLDPILDRFRQACRTIRFQPPRLPFVSNLTGDWIRPDQACDPEYWVNHLRSTVRFADGLATLRALGEPILVEMGPGRTLSMLAKAQEKPYRSAFNTVRHPQEPARDLEYALTSFGKIWAAGAQVDWPEFYSAQLRNRIPLPTYPFARDSYWVEPGRTSKGPSSRELLKREDVTDWFAQLTYRESPLVRRRQTDLPRRWLVLSHTPSLASEIKRELADEDVIVATPGRSLRCTADGEWVFDFNDPEQYTSLLQDIDEQGGPPEHIVFLAQDNRRNARSHSARQDRLFMQPTYLLQALGGSSNPVQVSIITTGLASICGEKIDPYQSLALGPVLAAPRELTHLYARCIDLPRQSRLGRWDRSVLDRLKDELLCEAEDPVVLLRSTGRWVRDIAPSPIAGPEDQDTTPADWLRENGAYLITGGLGGIGLQMAQHLASLKPVKLALLARTGLPPESAWDEIVSAKIESQTAQRIKAVRALRSAGADVMVLAGDVTDTRSLSAAIGEIRSAFGPLNGVIHAAGEMDDAPVMSKDTAMMRRLLGPKVIGTINLDNIIQEQLDVFVLFSSVASFLGLPGQVDYTAANAFLDAFAHARNQRAAGRSVVINWNAWRNVGMAAAVHLRQTGEALASMPSASPVWDGYTEIGTNRLYVRDFKRADDWVLNEHVVKNGQALLSGTSMLELARAAFADLYPGEPIKLSNLTFLAPFIVADDNPRRLSLQTMPNGHGSIQIAIRDGSNLDSTPLVICDAAILRTKPPEHLDLSQVAARCDQDRWHSPDGFLEQDFMDFGQRWANMKCAAFGQEEALVELELHSQFSSDLDTYGLHPALLDMATGGVQKLIPGVDLSREFYVPLSYDSVQIYGQMPAHVFSHVKCLPGSGDGLAYFNITLTDGSGIVFAEIARFTMKRLASDDAFASEAKPSHGAAHALRAGRLDAILEQAILPHEGVEAFNRIMAQEGLVQTIASSVDARLWRCQLDDERKNESGNDDTPDTFERPQLSADFEAPQSPAEIELAAIWSELLGVKKVGIRDDFFDLGGNSLIGVRLFAAIRRKHGLSLPLATLFETPTIRELSSLLAQRGIGESLSAADQATSSVVPTEWSPLVPMKKGLPGLRGIFAIHGAQGNIMKFKSLSDRLPDTRPVYGIQAYGTDGVQQPLDSIPEMARRYVEIIKTVQSNGPYTLAGYSGGGVIAFEMAQQLKQAGETADLVIMFDTIHPRAGDIPFRLSDRLKNLPRLHPSIVREAIETRLEKLPVIGSLIPKHSGPLHEETELEAASWRVSDAYHRAQDAYFPQPYDGQLVIVRARRTNLRFLQLGRSLGWEQHLSKPFIEMEVDATHATIFDEPAVSDMAEKVRLVLSE
ncbi:SDR family NAD(P)-dependent oxidoreductase [Hyphomonas sp.]|uniref:SDR family NAD(P)-dependent oxidoreductase n=1 Tax=Hyphomonas sp. TaxID=87 RepID=UPI0032EEE15C